MEENPIPSIGLGTYQMRGDVCVEIVKKALQMGYKLVDTAQVYRNEELVGRGVKESGVDRENIFITTKVGMGNQGFEESYESILRSMQKLDVEYLDLVLIHWPGSKKVPSDSPLNKEKRLGSWRGLCRLKSEGKVRRIGVSNFEIRHLVEMEEWIKEEEEMISEVKQQDDEMTENIIPEIPEVNQIEIHPFYPQKGLISYCHEHGIQVQGYSSFGGTDDKLELLEHPTILQLAQEVGMSAGQLLLKWNLQQDILVIPKSTNEERMRENLETPNLPNLPQTEIDQLNSLENGTKFCWDPQVIL